MFKNQSVNLFVFVITLTNTNILNTPQQLNISDCRGYIHYRNCQNEDNFDVEIYMTPSLMGYFLRLYDNQVLNPYYESYRLENARTFLSQNFNNFNDNYSQAIHGLIIEGMGESNMLIGNFFRSFYNVIRNRGFYVQINYRINAPINNLITTIVPYNNQMSFLEIITEC